MSNKEQCPKCKSYQICTERRPNGKKWCTECDHVLETGLPILKNHDPSKHIDTFSDIDFSTLKEKLDEGYSQENYMINATNRALEKLYDPEYKPQTFMGLQLDERLSSRALMAVIQELSKMRDYEDKMIQIKIDEFVINAPANNVQYGKDFISFSCGYESSIKQLTSALSRDILSVSFTKNHYNISSSKCAINKLNDDLTSMVIDVNIIGEIKAEETEGLRIAQLEQCRDEVRAVLERYEAQLDGDCNWNVNLSCSESGDGIYLYKGQEEGSRP